MRIEIDEDLVSEIVLKLSPLLEQEGLTIGLSESMVSVAVDAGIREHLTNVAHREAINLSILTKAATDAVDPIIEAKLQKLQALRNSTKMAAVSGN